MAILKMSFLSLALVITACASQPVKVPEALNPGANESLALIVPATGVQVYECRVDKWVFVAPEAQLFNVAGRLIGKHYAGPHWEAADGSKIVGSVKARADAPSTEDIPWLLLAAKSVGNEGAFSRVTSIQRVATSGGIAPTGACSSPGEQARVYYTADYRFFTAR